MSSEAGYDGGVLEYRVNGGAWNDAASLFRSGGYNSTIDTGSGSTIAGRQAWSGVVGSAVTFADVEVDLSGLSGSDVDLRWRFATDSSLSATGLVRGRRRRRRDDVRLRPGPRAEARRLRPLRRRGALDASADGQPVNL